MKNNFYSVDANARASRREAAYRRGAENAERILQIWYYVLFRKTLNG